MMFKRNVVIYSAIFLSLCQIAAPGFAATVELDNKIVPRFGSDGDNFGYSVAVYGATAIVGSYSDDAVGRYSGSAYIINMTDGSQIAKLTGSDTAANDVFGVSVAISENTAIIGSPADDDNGNASGSAYLFDVTTGEQVAKLTADDGSAGDQFGVSVDISGDTAIVSGHTDDDNGEDSGSAYLFDVTTGEQIAKLTASDAAAGDNFGYSVATSDTTAIVGSFSDGDNGAHSGSAYLFDVATGEQIAKLTADDGEVGDQFGISVAISDTTAIVGSISATGNVGNSGAVYLFDVTTGEQISKLTASDGVSGDGFGRSIAISGNIALVGSSTDEDDNGNQSGSVYVFDIMTGTQLAKLTASDGAEGDYFGVSVAISGTSAIIGTGSDSAYIYTLSGDYVPVAPVPLPAGMWLMITALGGLGIARRRAVSV